MCVVASDKDEIEGLAGTWLCRMWGQVSCLKETIDAETYLKQEFAGESITQDCDIF
jgi:hypothetical protein